MSRATNPAVKLLLLAAIIAALGVAAYLLDVPVIVVAAGAGLGWGALAAYAARLRRAQAGRTDRDAR
jgi:heme A synthase